MLWAWSFVVTKSTTLMICSFWILSRTRRYVSSCVNSRMKRLWGNHLVTVNTTIPSKYFDLGGHMAVCSVILIWLTCSSVGTKPLLVIYSSKSTCPFIRALVMTRGHPKAERISGPLDRFINRGLVCLKRSGPNAYFEDRVRLAGSQSRKHAPTSSAERKVLFVRRFYAIVCFAASLSNVC